MGTAQALENEICPYIAGLSKCILYYTVMACEPAIQSLGYPALKQDNPLSQNNNRILEAIFSQKLMCFTCRILWNISYFEDYF